MDYIALLKEDLEKGYSKSDLEKLVGLPKNNLSGILKGDRKLSKKSMLKIDKWMASEKPNPLSVYFDKSRGEIVKTVNDILEGGIAITHSDTNGMVKRIDPLSEEGQKAIALATKIPPMPLRTDFDNSIDFAAAKNEWKQQYNQ